MGDKELKPMNSTRIEELQRETAYPESNSVYRVLHQVWNECDQYATQELSSTKEEVERLREKYQDLIMSVGNKYDGESRHETAKRYIRQAEESTNDAAVTGQALSQGKDGAS